MSDTQAERTVLLDLTPEEAMHILGALNGDMRPSAQSIRNKLLKWLTQ
jgi:hypothetical protein